jgi:flagellar FliJ protein
MNKHTLSVERLTPIHDLSERREADAARILGDAQRVLEDRERQLTELENYQEPKLSPGAAALQSAAMLRNRELFRLRLAEAIRFQRAAVTEARARVENARAAWIATHQQTKVYEKLIQRSEAEQQRQYERRQQKELDELALRLLRAASAARSIDV